MHVPQEDEAAAPDRVREPRSRPMVYSSIQRMDCLALGNFHPVVMHWAMEIADGPCTEKRWVHRRQPRRAHIVEHTIQTVHYASCACDSL